MKLRILFLGMFFFFCLVTAMYFSMVFSGNDGLTARFLYHGIRAGIAALLSLVGVVFPDKIKEFFKRNKDGEDT